MQTELRVKTSILNQSDLEMSHFSAVVDLSLVSQSIKYMMGMQPLDWFRSKKASSLHVKTHC